MPITLSTDQIAKECERLFQKPGGRRIYYVNPETGYIVPSSHSLPMSLRMANDGDQIWVRSKVKGSYKWIDRTPGIGVHPPVTKELTGTLFIGKSAYGQASTPVETERYTPNGYKVGEAAKSRPLDPQVNPWHPITDVKQLRVLGKLGEETGELSAAVSRCIIQGVDGVEPVTGKVNRQWLMEELADVQANIDLAIEHFKLDEVFIDDRALMKRKKLRIWHAMA